MLNISSSVNKIEITELAKEKFLLKTMFKKGVINEPTYLKCLASLGVKDSCINHDTELFYK